MLRRVLSFAVEQRLVVLLLTGLLVAVGSWSAVRLPMDAVPDITNVQVQINTNSPALGPVEVERQITSPLEIGMLNLPRVTEVRSVSKFGLSQVTAIFEDGVDIYFARQLAQQRLQEARQEIPDELGVPQMGPVSTGLGEIFQYTIESPQRDLMELRTLQDWTVKPELLTVPGVAEVNAFGGYEKEYQVLVQPEELGKYELSLPQIVEAVSANNLNQGGGYVVQGGDQLVVRGVGQVQTLDQIRSIVISSRQGVPVRVSDVAAVAAGPALRQGAVTKDGRGEVASGIVLMLLGSNSRVVVENVKARVAELAKSLPEDVRLVPFYDRAELVDRAIRTVGENLGLGAALVIVVLFVLLGNFRAALIVALAIPFSMLFAVTLMVKAGVAGSLMSLGALDFGLVVDGSVVMVENAVRRLSGEGSRTDRIRLLLDSCLEVGRPIVFGVGIIIAVYLPILTLEGVEGKLFRPMALTVVFALIGSLLLTFTVTPALCSVLLGGNLPEGESAILRRAKTAYEPLLDRCLRHRGWVFLAAGALVVAALGILPFLGSSFIPRLDEGALALEMRRPPGISLEEANRLNSLIERRLLERFPDEVRTVVSKTGRAEVATDPVSPNSTDLTVMLYPRERWRKGLTPDELIAAIDEELRSFLGVSYEFSQPIEMRMNELIAGVRSDLAIKIFGEDLGVLRQTADETVAALSVLPGAQGFRAQQTGGLPMIQVTVDPEKIGRYGINAKDVMDAVQALAGIEATQILEERLRFPLVVKFPESVRRDARAIANIPVSAPGGERIPLASLCRIEEIEGPAEISHENASRLIFVQGNVRGRDIGSFVEDVRRVFDEGRVALPPGYRVEFGGQFENLERARNRLLIVVPLTLFLIFVLLFTTFNSVRQALLVFTGVPLATVGGVFALLLRGMPFTISAGVGFIALFGIAVLNGVVIVSYINGLRDQGRGVAEAVREGALVRLRPVLTTALVASLGFLPMALSTSAGAEVQRPLATVVIGGLVTATALTLLVLPTLYSWIEDRPEPVPR